MKNRFLTRCSKWCFWSAALNPDEWYYCLFLEQFEDVYNGQLCFETVTESHFLRISEVSLQKKKNPKNHFSADFPPFSPIFLAEFPPFAPRGASAELRLGRAEPGNHRKATPGRQMSLSSGRGLGVALWKSYKKGWKITIFKWVNQVVTVT